MRILVWPKKSIQWIAIHCTIEHVAALRVLPLQELSANLKSR